MLITVSFHVVVAFYSCPQWMSGVVVTTYALSPFPSFFYSDGDFSLHNVASEKWMHSVSRFTSTQINVCIGLARIVHIHRIWLQIWWSLYQIYHIHTIYILWFWPNLRMHDAEFLRRVSEEVCAIFVGLARTAYAHRIWPCVIFQRTILYIHRMYVWFWPALIVCIDVQA